MSFGQPGDKSVKGVISWVLDDAQNSAQVNQIRGINVANTTIGSGIPIHVANVSASVSNAKTGTTNVVTVTFRRNPADVNFSKAQVYLSGYNGNGANVLVASGADSPISFVLNNTGESVIVVVQASGNAGDAPIQSAPTTGLKLPKSTAGGYSTSTSTGSSATFETNGVANSTQSLLNLSQGTGMTLSESAGTVTIASTNAFSTAGRGGFWGPGIVMPPLVNFNNSINVVATNNEVRVTQFVLTSTWTIRKVSIRITGGTAGKKGFFGIYSADGNTLLVDGGTFTIASNPQLITNTLGAAVVLAPNTYYFAQSATDNVNFNTVGANTSASGIDIYNANANRMGIAANGTGGTNLPATLGAITPATDASTGASTWTALPFFEP